MLLFTYKHWSADNVQICSQSQKLNNAWRSITLLKFQRIDTCDFFCRPGSHLRCRDEQVFNECVYMHILTWLCLIGWLCMWSCKCIYLSMKRLSQLDFWPLRQSCPSYKHINLLSVGRVCLLWQKHVLTAD